MNTPTIRILEPDAQSRGDLFGRLMEDLFHVLGYHEFRLNVPKSGRELDLRGQHRTENHASIAECKATTATIGGSDLNKFAGALDVERSRPDGQDLEGYFISLNGFKASALEQESEFPRPRLILLDGSDVVRELIAGKIVCSETDASAAAAHCIAKPTRLSLKPHLELLAHASGWYWCAIFSEHGTPTLCVLVHADGTALNKDAATPIIHADTAVEGTLATLRLAAPSMADSASELTTARAKYEDFLRREYGDITVDGLPADERIGSRNIALSDLFVPLHLEPVETNDAIAEDESGDAAISAQDSLFDEELLEDTDDDVDSVRYSVGSVMAKERRIAILGPPGSGKSTLLKRLAVAYGVAGKRTEIDDDLPDSDWLPFVVRCRQLNGLATGSFHDVLASIAKRAEMPQHEDAFRNLTDIALRQGTALILVDGLDEIADPQVRLTLVKQLRTFVGTYPNVQLVLTSREAGFRIVAGALGDVSTSYRVGDFDDADIASLASAWTILVSNNSPTARDEAAKIATSIIKTDRVRRLARNPLLLTTLLLVRRWVGDLPKKRTALYAKAIEVLLMTWNVEAHKPIDLDDAIPQLAFVAFAMTSSKTQILSRKHLVALLEQARDEMPEVLGHSDLTPGQFLERIEERSSLLSLSGHILEDGIVMPVYEFKHLTFQEYLTAVAVAEGFYMGRVPDETPQDVVSPHINEPQWLEVIPMVTVLVGRRATPIIEELIVVADDQHNQPAESNRPTTLLARCLADEAQIPFETLARAVRVLSDARHEMSDSDLAAILSSKYGESFRKSVAQGFLGRGADYSRFGGLLSLIAVHDHFRRETSSRPKWEAIVAVVEEVLIPGGTPLQWSEGCLMLMSLVFEGTYPSADLPIPHATMSRMGEVLEPGLSAENASVRYAAAWAYAWVGRQASAKSEFVPKVLPLLYRLWKEARIIDSRKMMAWAFLSLPLLPRSSKVLGTATNTDVEFLMREWSSRPPSESRREDRRPAALVASYYFGVPWTQSEIEAAAKELNETDPLVSRLQHMLGIPAPTGPKGRQRPGRLVSQRRSERPGRVRP